MKKTSKMLTMLALITTLMTSFSFATELKSETEEKKNSQYEPFYFVNVDGKTMYTDKEGIPNTGVYAYHKPKNKMVYITKKGAIKDLWWRHGRCYYASGKYYVNTTTPDGYKVNEKGAVVSSYDIHPQALHQRAFFEAIEEDTKKEIEILINEYRVANGKKALERTEILDGLAELESERTLKESQGAPKSLPYYWDKLKESGYMTGVRSSRYRYIRGSEGFGEDGLYVSGKLMSPKNLANKILRQWINADGKSSDTLLLDERMSYYGIDWVYGQGEEYTKFYPYLIVTEMFEKRAN